MRRKRALGFMLAVLALAASLGSVRAATGGGRRVAPRSGLYSGALPDQLDVAASRNQIGFIEVQLPPGRPCSGLVFGHSVAISATGHFRGRGPLDRGRQDSYLGRFLSSTRAEGTATRVQYRAPGRVTCRASAHFDVRWRRPL